MPLETTLWKELQKILNVHLQRPTDSSASYQQPSLWTLTKNTLIIHTWYVYVAFKTSTWEAVSKIGRKSARNWPIWSNSMSTVGWRSMWRDCCLSSTSSFRHIKDRPILSFGTTFTTKDKIHTQVLINQKCTQTAGF